MFCELKMTEVSPYSWVPVLLSEGCCLTDRMGKPPISSGPVCTLVVVLIVDVNGVQCDIQNIHIGCSNQNRIISSLLLLYAITDGLGWPVSSHCAAKLENVLLPSNCALGPITQHVSVPFSLTLPKFRSTFFKASTHDWEHMMVDFLCLT
jgi:hypothetical protein